MIENGYIKLLALDVDHLETTIVMETNTNSQCEIDEFKELYGNKKNIIIFIIHMNYNNEIKFNNYRRICNNIHPFDYIRDLISKKNGYMLHRSDITNEKLYDQSRVTYIQNNNY